jgi:dCMP deaminase
VSPKESLTMSSVKKYDVHYLRLAWMTSVSMSKDPRTKVGACLVTPDTRQLSVGYNGFPAGIPEPPELWSPDHKYDYVVHAEVNAILNAPFDTKGTMLYCTHKPCSECLKAAINARVGRIIYIERPDWEPKETEVYKTLAKVYRSKVTYPETHSQPCYFWEKYTLEELFPSDMALNFASVLPKLEV